ncbi:hypothetical protein HC928_22825 [bacterium]|nr:hypothetical protein [bacterium]
MKVVFAVPAPCTLCTRRAARRGMGCIGDGKRGWAGHEGCAGGVRRWINPPARDGKPDQSGSWGECLPIATSSFAARPLKQGGHPQHLRPRPQIALIQAVTLHLQHALYILPLSFRDLPAVKIPFQLLENNIFG